MLGGEGKENGEKTTIGLISKKATLHQGPVVRRPISANPGVKFNPGFFFLCSKVFSRIIFSVIFRSSNHQIVDKKD